MEEGGKSDFESLSIRANRFAPLEDLAGSHTNFAGHDMRPLSTSTWGLMSSLVGRLSGASDWWSANFRREYQSQNLGRLDGDTFLTEILPLPKRSFHDWPYGMLFDSPDAYQSALLPERRKQLRAEYASSNPKPEFIFCYGKSFWPEHKRVFDDIDFSSAIGANIEWGVNDKTVVILTKFFDYGRMGFSQQFVDELC